MPDLESQNAVPSRTSSNFDGVCDALAAQLYDLSSHVNNISKLLSRQKTRAAGGGRGSRSGAGSLAFDERIVRLAEETTDKFKKAKNDVQLVTEWESSVLVGKQKLAQERLNREFSTLLGQFRTQQREIAELQRQTLVASKTQQLVEEEEQRRQTESTPLLSPGGAGSTYTQEAAGQTQILDLVRQEDVDFQSSLIQERELEIAGIQDGIAEINTIFRDLGALVTQQGDHIDTFENNISNIATNTKQAGDELVAANEYQRKRRNCSFCVLMVLIIVLSVIVLAVTVS